MHSTPTETPPHPSIHIDDSCGDVTTGGSAVAANVVIAGSDAADGAAMPLMSAMSVETATVNATHVRPRTNATAAHTTHLTRPAALTAGNLDTPTR